MFLHLVLCCGIMEEKLYLQKNKIILIMNLLVSHFKRLVLVMGKLCNEAMVLQKDVTITNLTV